MRRSILTLFAGLYFLLMSGQTVIASTFDSSAEKIRTTFMLHIVNYALLTEQQQARRPLRFCFLEDNKSRYYKVMSDPDFKRDARIPLKIVQINKLADEEVEDCMFLFVGRNKESSGLFEKLENLNQKMVTIGETSSFVNRGGQLSLVERAKKIKIVIHRAQYDMSPVKFSAKLLRYANFTG